jgi:hypothetical protein
MLIGATRSNTDGNLVANTSILWNVSNHDMLFGTNNTERIRIASGGNVGINTPTPLERLSVTGNAHIAGVGNALYFDTDGSGRSITQYVNNLYEFHILNGRGNSARFILGNGSISLGTSATPQLFIDTSNGNIGIGTSSPFNRLHVNSTSGDVIYLSSFQTTSGAINTGPFLSFGFHDGINPRDAASIRALKENATSGNHSSYLSFSTRETGVAVTERMRITSGGSMLVGTTSNFSNIRLQVAGRIYAEGLLGYSYSQTSTSGTTSIVDTYIDNNSFGQSAMYLISYGGNPNAGGSGAYKVNYVGYISVATGWSGSNVTRYIRYTPVAQFDAPNVGALTLTVFFFNGSTETASINEQSTSGYYIRLKITGYNSSFVGSEQYVYLTKVN